MFEIGGNRVTSHMISPTKVECASLSSNLSPSLSLFLSTKHLGVGITIHGHRVDAHVMIHLYMNFNQEKVIYTCIL